MLGSILVKIEIHQNRRVVHTAGSPCKSDIALKSFDLILTTDLQEPDRILPPRDYLFYDEGRMKYILKICINLVQLTVLFC